MVAFNLDEEFGGGLRALMHGVKGSLSISLNAQQLEVAYEFVTKVVIRGVGSDPFSELASDVARPAPGVALGHVGEDKADTIKDYHGSGSGLEIQTPTLPLPLPYPEGYGYIRVLLMKPSRVRVRVQQKGTGSQTPTCTLTLTLPCTLGLDPTLDNP